MSIRWILKMVAVAVLLVSASGCEQLGLLKNNKTRIAGTWYLYEYGFKDDSQYYFSEGFIKRDDSAWGTYKFIQNSVVEVVLNDDISATFNVEFADDDEVMYWFELVNGERINRYEWRKS